MADAQALGACAARRQGSNPCFPSNIRDEVTTKHLYLENGKVQLVYTNGDFKEMQFDQVEIPRPGDTVREIGKSVNKSRGNHGDDI